ncbi:glycosyltransferase family 10 domain-containing protein [Hymenobacter sediminicola]|uniref:Fucosyltransferase C-terminal domain-containing protein n=1 Tax=Hymenobacter sediminicola TaxID=2761579 RepID=A0A7G7W536_9BACT|nr:glycosyltransferase family 10 [Hymenobacter sediminicola]QNH61479.1 hypothetical protein H4317_15130 [Hymenobacter sediminicola]
MKATLYVHHDAALLGNKIFSDEPINGMKRDTYLYAALCKVLSQRGIELATQDIHPPQESDLIICLDQPMQFQHFVRTRPGQKLHLILTEPATYYPENWLVENHAPFDRILTYDPTRVDNTRYFQYHYAIDFKDFPRYKRPSEEEFAARKLCVLMAAAFGVVKPPKGSGSLLYERYQTLKWFSEHHPEEFDLFSRGISPKTYVSFRGAGFLSKVLPTYALQLVSKRRERVFARVNRGSVPPNQKIEILQHYRFPISYENTGDTPGYLTEKLFDALAAACVPIYLGHADASRLVPAECFINRSDFRSHEELYQFLKGMGYEEYARYLDASEAFLKSPAMQLLSTEYNAHLMAGVLTQPH